MTNHTPVQTNQRYIFVQCRYRPRSNVGTGHDDMQPNRSPKQHQQTASHAQAALLTNASPLQLKRTEQPLLSITLLGPRCYTDASFRPDDNSTTRHAGLVIFLLHQQGPTRLTLYVQAQLSHTASALTAEATTITLAALITKQLQQNLLLSSQTTKLWRITTTKE